MRPSPLATAALVATLALAAPAITASATPRERARAAALAAELEAARHDHLYLLLDAAGAWLDLKAHGLTLRRFPISAARFGQPRFAAGAPAWPAASFELASELPEPARPRVPIQAAGEAEAPGVPRTAVRTAGQGDPLARRRRETLAMAPTHYRLRFEPGLEVSVRGEAGHAPLAGRALGLSHRAVESLGAGLRRLAGRPAPPRVVLEMTPEDAQRLYLALLPRTRLVLHVPG